MKRLAPAELEVGKTYLFKRAFNSKQIIFQPAVYLGLWQQTGELKPGTFGHPAPRLKVKFCLDGCETTVSMTQHISPLTKGWLEGQMTDRAEAIRQLQAEASVLFNLHKELK